MIIPTPIKMTNIMDQTKSPKIRSRNWKSNLWEGMVTDFEKDRVKEKIRMTKKSFTTAPPNIRSVNFPDDLVSVITAIVVAGDVGVISVPRRREKASN